MPCCLNAAGHPLFLFYDKGGTACEKQHTHLQQIWILEY